MISIENTENCELTTTDETHLAQARVKIVLLNDFDDFVNTYIHSFVKIEDEISLLAGRKKGDEIIFSLSPGKYRLIAGNDISSKIKTINIDLQSNRILTVGVKSLLLNYDFFCC